MSLQEAEPAPKEELKNSSGEQSLYWKSVNSYCSQPRIPTNNHMGYLTRLGQVQIKTEEALPPESGSPSQTLQSPGSQKEREKAGADTRGASPPACDAPSSRPGPAVSNRQTLEKPLLPRAPAWQPRALTTLAYLYMWPTDGAC